MIIWWTSFLVAKAFKIVDEKCEKEGAERATLFDPFGWFDGFSLDCIMTASRGESSFSCICCITDSVDTVIIITSDTRNGHLMSIKMFFLNFNCSLESGVMSTVKKRFVTFICRLLIIFCFDVLKVTHAKLLSQIKTGTPWRWGACMTCKHLAFALKSSY